MPRAARKVITGIPHHIVHRGNNRQDIFFVPQDYKTYLDILKQQSRKYAMTILGYCLMKNHVHIIAIPQNEDSLAKAVGRTGFIYTQYINKFHNRSGHLWQGRFYSCALDERHFLTAMRYIECNPLRARICHKPWNYEWSSAAMHINERSWSDLLNLQKWFEDIKDFQWQKILMEKIDEKAILRIRGNTHTGRPLGSDSFISKLEIKIGCRLRPLPIGRPKRNEK